jgi:hypothetical protein
VADAPPRLTDQSLPVYHLSACSSHSPLKKQSRVSFFEV